MPTTATNPPKKTWQDWLNDALAIGTGEKSPSMDVNIGNVPEIRNALLAVAGVALGGWLLVKLILWGISRGDHAEKQAA